MRSKPLAIVDAWNLIYGVPQFRTRLADNPDRARKELTRWAAAWLGTRRDLAGFWIVFDGGVATADAQTAVGVCVLNSGPHEKADARILRLVRGHVRTRRLIVVSDDRALTTHCRALGAETQSVHAFFALSPWTAQRRPFPADTGGDAKTDLSPAQRKAIDDELRRHYGLPEDTARDA